ncbi:MAG: TonB family protein [Pseudomonadota bacterium]|nr:TonB family protein [Pseudomonadota bacterium]
MSEPGGERGRDRIKASLGVLAFHAVLGYALITGLAFEVGRTVSDSLKIFEVEEILPPPLEERPAPEASSPHEEGAAAPPNLASEATPIVAPPPKIRVEVPPPVVAAPLPTQRPGNDPTAGTSTVMGLGTGSGGEGSGTASGGSGMGTGGAGGGARARLERGRLLNEDYPRRAMRAGAEGIVSVLFTVGTDGRAGGCRVTRSSGNADLDRTTCRLIEQRFRYKPATDAEGKPVPELITKTYEWLLPLKRGPSGCVPSGAGCSAPKSPSISSGAP